MMYGRQGKQAKAINATSVAVGSKEIGGDTL